MKYFLMCLVILACCVGCGGKKVDGDSTKIVDSTNNKSEFLSKIEEIRIKDDEFNKNDSLSQLEINTHSSEVYTAYDSLLNEIYANLKANMAESEFEKLEIDEAKWVKAKEDAMDREGALWEGGSGETMARNSVGISFTSDRCEYLISLMDDFKFVDKPYVIRTVSPSGFAGSSLNEIRLYSNNEVYWVQFDGEGMEDNNIVKNELIAKNIESMNSDDENVVLISGDKFEIIDKDTLPAWILVVTE